MSNMLNDDELDSLFKDSIESAEAQPSEKFWTKAYEGILTRENNAYLSRIRTWKRATMALACLVIGLICYSVYITEKVNNLDNQVAQVEKFQANSTAQNATVASNNNAASINGKNTNSSNKLEVSNNDQSSVNSVNAANSVNSGSSTQGLQVNNAVSNESGVVSANQKMHSNNSTSHNGASFAANSHKNQGNRRVVAVASNEGNASQRNVITMLGSNKTAVTSHTEETETNTNNDNQTISNVLYPDESYSSNDSPDSAVSQPVITKSHQPSKFKRYVLPHVSASVFASYNMADPVMNGYSSGDNLSASQLNSRERQTLAYSFGAKLGYDLSTKWTLQAGISYQVYQFSIASSTLSPQKQGSESNYQLVTSSGNVYLPFMPNSNINATVTAKGNALRSYVNIPLQAKYNFVNSRTFKIYGTFGATMGLLEFNKVSAQAVNSTGSENVNVNSVDGTSQVTCSYLLGVGAEYKIGRAFSVYAEPSYLGAITPVNNSSLIKVSNNVLNGACGVIYHF
jgi:hypothetical protein